MVWGRYLPMRAAPQDLGYDRVRQVYLDQRPPHYACGHEHSLALPNPGVSNCYGLSVEDDDEEQARHHCDFQLRLLVSLPLQLSQEARCVWLTRNSTIVSGIMRLVYSIRVTQTDDIFLALYPVAMWT